MKQETRFKKFGNIGYRSIISRYIGIGPKKAILGRSLIITHIKVFTILCM